MNKPARLWFDVSYTRTHRGSDIGMTRTVRRLFAGLNAQHQDCRAVAFHSAGFRQVDLPEAIRQERDPERGIAQVAFRWLNGSIMRAAIRLVMRVLPWSALRPIWQAASTTSFNGLSESARPISFSEGDVLIMADASWNYAAWLPARIARSQGARVVLLVYDLMPLRHPEFCFPLVPPLFERWLIEMLACSDAVICISLATQNDLERWICQHRSKSLPGRVGHFRLGSDPVGTVVSGASIRQDILRFMAAPLPCFAAVGSVEPKKNYGFLLKVFEQLWELGHELRLIIAGRATTDCAELLDTLHRHPQRGRLLLSVHDATDAEVLHIYASCRALVLPSLFEGFGLPLVEARSRGCPVISSNLPVFTELSDGGVTQFDLDSEASLMTAVLAHAADDRRLQTAAMPEFTWDHSADDCRKLIESLLSPASVAR